LKRRRRLFHHLAANQPIAGQRPTPPIRAVGLEDPLLVADVFECTPIDKARKSALAAEAADDESWLRHRRRVRSFGSLLAAWATIASQLLICIRGEPAAPEPPARLILSS
jgi:hypothetical protein